MEPVVSSPHHPGPRTPPLLEDRDWLVTATANGLTQAEIAAEAGCSTRTVIRAMQRLGVACQTAVARPPQLDDAAWLTRRYLEEGATIAAIATEVGSATETVAKALRRHGFPVRPGGSPVLYPQLHDVDWLRDRYQTQRRSSADIAAELGCSPSAVGMALVRHGIPVSAGSFPVRYPELRDEAWLKERFAAPGVSAAAVAAELGCAAVTVRRALSGAGLAR